MENKPTVQPGKQEVKREVKPSATFTRMKHGGVIQSVPNKDVEDFKKKGFTVV